MWKRGLEGWVGEKGARPCVWENLAIVGEGGEGGR